MTKTFLSILITPLCLIGCTSNTKSQEGASLAQSPSQSFAPSSNDYQNADKSEVEKVSDSLAHLSYPVTSTNLLSDKSSIVVEGRYVKDADFKTSIFCKIENKTKPSVVSLKFVYLLKNPVEKVDWIVKKRIAPNSTINITLSPEKDIHCKSDRLVDVFLFEAVLEDGTFVNREVDRHKPH